MRGTRENSSRDLRCHRHDPVIANPPGQSMISYAARSLTRDVQLRHHTPTHDDSAVGVPLRDALAASRVSLTNPRAKPLPASDIAFLLSQLMPAAYSGDDPTPTTLKPPPQAGDAFWPADDERVIVSWEPRHIAVGTVVSHAPSDHGFGVRLDYTEGSGTRIRAWETVGRWLPLPDLKSARAKATLEGLEASRAASGKISALTGSLWRECMPNSSCWAHSYPVRLLLFDATHVEGEADGDKPPRVLGAVYAEPKSRYIGCLCVAPSARRHGLGRLLVRAVAAVLLPSGAQPMPRPSLTVSPKDLATTPFLYAFYESLGFLRTGCAFVLPEDCREERSDTWQRRKDKVPAT